MRDMAEQLNRDTPNPAVEDASVEERPVLVSDEITNQLARSGKPTYGVQMVGKDGVSKPVLAASGKPMRWNPDHARAFDKNIDARQNDAGLGDEVIDGGIMDVPGNTKTEPETQTETESKAVTESDAALGDEVMDVEVSDDDAKKLNELEADLDAEGEGLTDEQIRQYGELVLSFAPGIGEALSAKDAYYSFQAARKAYEHGDLTDAGIESAYAFLGVMGAIPGAGIPFRAVKTLAKALKIGRGLGKALPKTASMTRNQIKRHGGRAEGGRLRGIKPKFRPSERLGGANAFKKMSPRKAFLSTKFPPKTADENIFRGMAGIDLLIQQVKRGRVDNIPAAMHRVELPAGQRDIAFHWGKPGEGSVYTGGSGFSKIIAKHGIEALETVLDTIAKGTAKVVKNEKGELRMKIKKGKGFVSLALDRSGKKQSWVLTGYDTTDGANAHFDLSKLDGGIFFKGGKKSATR